MAKGRFVPRNPHKYMGNPNQIFFRSSWELTVLRFFDSSNSVSRYASEEIVIPYISPKDGKMHRYYPDFFFEMINTKQEIERWLVEVKPLKETSYEHAKSTYDKIAIAINEAKWAAAEKFCILNGLKFKVITELDIYKMAPQTAKTRTRKTKANVGTKKTIGTKRTNTKRKPKNAKNPRTSSGSNV